MKLLMILLACILTRANEGNIPGLNGDRLFGAVVDPAGLALLKSCFGRKHKKLIALERQIKEQEEGKTFPTVYKHLICEIPAMKSEILTPHLIKMLEYHGFTDIKLYDEEDYNGFIKMYLYSGEALYLFNKEGKPFLIANASNIYLLKEFQNLPIDESKIVDNNLFDGEKATELHEKIKGLIQSFFPNATVHLFSQKYYVRIEGIKYYKFRLEEEGIIDGKSTKASSLIAANEDGYYIYKKLQTPELGEKVDAQPTPERLKQDQRSQELRAEKILEQLNMPDINYDLVLNDKQSAQELYNKIKILVEQTFPQAKVHPSSNLPYRNRNSKKYYSFELEENGATRLIAANEDEYFYPHKHQAPQVQDQIPKQKFDFYNGCLAMEDEEKFTYILAYKVETSKQRNKIFQKLKFDTDSHTLFKNLELYKYLSFSTQVIFNNIPYDICINKTKSDLFLVNENEFRSTTRELDRYIKTKIAAEANKKIKEQEIDQVASKLRDMQRRLKTEENSKTKSIRMRQSNPNTSEKERKQIEEEIKIEEGIIQELKGKIEELTNQLKLLNN